jgi:hypothetical protein
MGTDGVGCGGVGGGVGGGGVGGMSDGGGCDGSRGCIALNHIDVGCHVPRGERLVCSFCAHVQRSHAQDLVLGFIVSIPVVFLCGHSALKAVLASPLDRWLCPGAAP